MIIRALIGFVTVGTLFAQHSLAQSANIVVRASDIRGGSRIDVPLGSTPFAIEPAGRRTIDIIAPDMNGGFDVSQITRGGFASRIENARVVQSDRGTRLRLLLNCDCSFATMVTDGTLTVEIRDPLEKDNFAEADSETENRQKARRFASNVAPARSPSPKSRDEARQTSSNREVNPSSEASKIDLVADNVDPIDLDPEDEAASRTQEVLLARERLVEQLAKAAQQGLLDFATEESAQLFDDVAVSELPPEQSFVEPNEPTIAEELEPVRSPVDSNEEAVESRLVEGAANRLVELPVRARTARDKAFRIDRGETVVKAYNCFDDDKYKLPLETQDKQFSEVIAEFNGALLNRFDQPDPLIVEKLARYYIAAGFGAEAIHVLNVFGADVSDSLLLRDLAVIVDGKRPSVNGPVARNGHCSGKAHLWFEIAGFQMETGAIERLSASGQSPKAGKDEEKSLVDAFIELPRILRSYLGPQIMNQAIDVRNIPRAERFDRIMRRMVNVDGAALDLARARLLAAGGSVESAEAMYQQLALLSVPEAHNALLLLLESQIERGAEPSVALADALADAAFVARGSSYERRLKVAEIRARAMAEGLSAALVPVTRAINRGQNYSPILMDAAHAVFEDAIADQNQPLSFVREILDHKGLISTAADGDLARTRVATQLIKIGLANAALDVLEPSAERQSSEYRLAKAKALIQLTEGIEALEVLEGLDGEAAASLRTQAFSLIGQPESAWLEAQQDSQLEDAERAKLALRAGLWRDAAVAGDASDRLLAAYMAKSDERQPVAAGEAQSLSENAETAELTSDLENTAPAASAAMLRPPSVQDDLTLKDAQAVKEASETIRTLVGEILEDG